MTVLEDSFTLKWKMYIRCIDSYGGDRLAPKRFTWYSSRAFLVLASRTTKLESILSHPETMGEITVASLGISSKMTTVRDASVPSVRMVLLLVLSLRRRTLRQWESGQSK